MKEELSFEEQIDYAVILNELKKLNPKEQKNLMDALLSDLDSYNVYLKMDNIADLIDTFFGNNEEFIMQMRPEVIEEEIAKLPEYHLLHVEDESITKIYNKYCSKLYKFMLYENIQDRKKLFKKNEVRSIVVNEAIKDLKNMSPREDMPNEIYNIAYHLRYDKNYTPNITSDILKYLYAIKNDIELNNYNKELEIEKNKKIRINDELNPIKKDLRKKRFKLYKAIGFGVGIPAVTFIGPFIGLRHFIKPDTVKMQHVTSDTTNGKEHTDSYAVESYLGKNTLNELMNTERKFVTVFGDTNDEMVEVKVYDYTGTNLSNDELKTIELDNSKIIYSKVLKTEKFKINSLGGLRQVYGVYTGSAHRDISTVKFKKEKEGKAMMIFKHILFVMLLSAVALISAFIPLAFGIYDTEFKELYEEIIDLKNDKKLTLEEYEKVLNKIKKLKERIDLEKKKKEVIGNTTVEKELEEHKPTGYRI